MHPQSSVQEVDELSSLLQVRLSPNGESV
ncbi:MAG: hypothetical protein CMB73_05890 [Euryarchaeota archaeon]|nr:hypothetical protein [Euryarchaeota archaeon]